MFLFGVFLGITIFALTLRISDRLAHKELDTYHYDNSPEGSQTRLRNRLKGISLKAQIEFWKPRFIKNGLVSSIDKTTDRWFKVGLVYALVSTFLVLALYGHTELSNVVFSLIMYTFCIANMFLAYFCYIDRKQIHKIDKEFYNYIVSLTDTPKT